MTMTLDTRAVGEALQAFINTSTPRDAIEVFRNHADVLQSDQALALLASNQARFPDDAELQAIFDLRRRAIEAARERGVNAGVAQLYVPNPETERAVLAFVNAPYVDQIQMLRREPALAAPDSVEFLEMLALRHPGNSEAANAINVSRLLIHVANRQGVEAARQWLRQEFVETLQNSSATDGELVSAWETALALSEGDTDPLMRAQIRVNLSQAYRSRGDPGDIDRAIDELERALEVMTSDAHPEHFSGIHRILGNIFFGVTSLPAETRCRRAIEHYALALPFLSPDVDAQNYLHVNFMLGACWQTLAEPARARACLLAGLAAVDLADLDQAIESCASVAPVMNGGGNETATALHNALSILSSRIERLPADSEPNERAHHHYNIANVYRESFGPWLSDDIERAIAHTDAASRVWTREANPDRWARTQHNLGAAYMKRVEQEKADNIEQAIQYYDNALIVHTQQNFPRSWALTHNALGTAWLERIKGNKEDNAEVGLKLLSQALTVWDVNGDAFMWGECYNSLGAAHLRLVPRYGRTALDRAIDCFERTASVHTRARYPSRWAQVSNNLANAYLQRNELGDAELAIDMLRQSITAIDPVADSYLWATFKKNEGAAHSQVMGGDVRAHEDAAIASFRAALTVFDEHRYPAEHRDTQAALGQMWFRRGAWADALAAYRDAIRAAELVFDHAFTETGRLSEAEELSSIYRNAAFCLIRLGQPHDALELYDRGKTRVLADAIELSRARFDGLSAHQRDEATRARDEIANAEAQMRLPESAPGRPSDATLGRVIAQSRGRLAKVIGRNATARKPLHELLQAIPERGALVVPVLTSQGGVAFVVPHGLTTISSAHIVQLAVDFDEANNWLIGTEERPGLLRTYVDYLNQGREDPEPRRRAFTRYTAHLQRVCQDLWRSLMQPIVERLETHGLPPQAQVLLIPHGALALLPLHAASAAPGQYLMQRFDVQYSPSLAVKNQALAPSNRFDTAATLLAISDPGHDLEFSELECRELARVFGGDNTVVLSGDAATRDAVIGAASRATHLHFSCHGFYDWRDAIRSGLVLANQEVLSVADIMSPQVDLEAARLVVLAACETGLFDYNRYPDEFVGLNSGLLLAGARAVASTLWAVEDRSTALLMSEFYRRLARGERIGSALAQSQVWLSELTNAQLEVWVRERATIFAAHALQHSELEPVAEAFASWQDQLSMSAFDANSRPFEHPYYWAAFIKLGAV